MGEPIKLYKTDGEVVVMYGSHQAAFLVASGVLSWEPVREEEEKRLLPKPVSVAMRASPAARKLAKKHGVNLADVTGTGKSGWITKPDVQAVVDGNRG